MDKYTTKYFGEVELWIYDGSWADFDTTYDGQEITISFADYCFFKDKIKLCWEMIDKYVEINEIAKKAIIEHFPKNGFVNDYFKFYFEESGFLTDEVFKSHFEFLLEEETFANIDIKKTVEGMGYPEMIFMIDDEGKISFSVDYRLSKEYSDQILLVLMDEELNITGFSIES